MNPIPLLISLMLFQGAAEDYKPTPETDLTLVYLGAFVVVIVVGVIILATVIFLVTRRKRIEPQSIITAPKPSQQPLPPPPGTSRVGGQLPPPPGDSQVGGRLPPPPGKQKPVPPAIFLSYRREDTSDVTGRIYDRLSERFGKENVFKDVDSIPLGVDFKEYLENAVGQCDVLLAIIGRQWIAGEKGKRRLDEAHDFVRIEMEAALKRVIPIVPVLVQGSGVPAAADLPEPLQPLARRHGIPVRPDPDFHQDMDRLIKGIEGYLKTTKT